VFIERDQRVDLNLACGQTSTAAAPQPTQTGATVETCTLPDGFRSVNVTRRRNGGLRFRFSRKVDNAVTVDVFQTAVGRRILRAAKRVRRFRNREAAFSWNGRGAQGRRLRSGMYYVRFRMLDAEGRIDSRRIVLKRTNGRFAKRPGYYLVDRCD
jgi:hypothetical protein